MTVFGATPRARRLCWAVRERDAQVRWRTICRAGSAVTAIEGAAAAPKSSTFGASAATPKSCRRCRCSARDFPGVRLGAWGPALRRRRRRWPLSPGLPMLEGAAHRHSRECAPATGSVAASSAVRVPGTMRAMNTSESVAEACGAAAAHAHLGKDAVTCGTSAGETACLPEAPADARRGRPAAAARVASAAAMLGVADASDLMPRCAHR